MNRPTPTCPKCGSTAVSYTQARLYDGHTSRCHTCGETFDQVHAYAAATAKPERVTLQYRAPIYVTVNLTSGDVERVYMADEGATFDDQGEHVHGLDGPSLISDPAGPALIMQAQAIADKADWTSTENRCAVWRGADGGPAGADEIIRLALSFAGAVHDSRIDPDDLKAVRQWVDDQIAWKQEHAPR